MISQLKPAVRSGQVTGTSCAEPIIIITTTLEYLRAIQYPKNFGFIFTWIWSKRKSQTAENIASLTPLTTALYIYRDHSYTTQ